MLTYDGKGKGDYSLSNLLRELENLFEKLHL